jgi:PEP-CTERM motif
MSYRNKLGLAAALAAGAMGLSSPAWATLHGFCGASAATSTCTDNGTITPTSQNPLLEFGFTRSPDSNSGLTSPTFELVALVPDTAAGAGSQTLTYTGTGTGVTTATTLSLVGDFTSGTLDAFLGLTKVSGGGPANPISGFEAGETNQGLPSTGFDVYDANFGSVAFGSPDPTFAPSGGFNGALIQGTEIYALIEGPATGQRQDATALSSTIIVATTSVPEPATWAMMALGFAGLGYAGFRRSRKGAISFA